MRVTYFSFLLCVGVCLAQQQPSHLRDSVTANEIVHSSGTYIAAAAEHTVTYAKDPAETMQMNLNGYETNLAAAQAKGVQIIVFPEFGLGGDFDTYVGMTKYCEPIPDPPTAGSEPLPCGGDGPAVFTRGSCMAKKYKMTIVLSVCDVDVVNKKQYVADVVYDENGRYITKYWKSHPFFTNLFDKPEVKYVTFKTSFGVTFGIFICFDIYFSDPPVELLKMGIRHFVHSQDLTNILGPEVERVWSLVHGATILGSNLGDNYSGVFRKGKRMDTEIIESRDVELDRVRLGAVPKDPSVPRTVLHQNLPYSSTPILI